MNTIFLSLIVASIVSLIFTNPQNVLVGLNEGASKALSFSLYMLPIYAIWLGILEIMEKSKLTKKLSKFLKPFIRFLFGKQDETIENLRAQNIAGNLIGVGGVATPSGIEACTLMQKEKMQISTFIQSSFVFENKKKAELEQKEIGNSSKNKSKYI